MKRVRVNGRELAYVEAGDGEQTVVLSHCWLLDHRHYAAQIEAMKSRFRVLAYDHRDHGQSDRADGPYTLDDLCADAVGFIEAMGAAPCHFIGLSTGGFVGLRVALRRPELIRQLVLMDTSAGAEPWPNRLRNEGMYIVLRALGFRPLLGAALDGLFGPEYRRAPANRDAIDGWIRCLLELDRGGVSRFGRAISRRRSVEAQLPAIGARTLVVVGEDDRTTPPRYARRITAGIPDAELVVVPRAGHLVTVENPAVVNEALLEFLS